MATDNKDQQLNYLAASLRKADARVSNMEEALTQLRAYLDNVGQTPKFIDQMPGKREPFTVSVNIAIAANSTSRISGSKQLSVDGEFVITGIAAFNKLTSGAYAGAVGPATTFGAKISSVSQQHGFMRLFDSPAVGSYELEIRTEGSSRYWQDGPFASGLLNDNAGGAYIIPVQYLVGRGGSLVVDVTPLVVNVYAATLQVLFLGYKIVTGSTYA
jgi:hypothetical protein